MARLKSDKKYVVAKSHVLNEMRTSHMELQELRLFSIYLAMINPLDESTKTVRFPMADLQAVLGLDQPNIPYFKSVAKSLAKKVHTERLPKGGFELFPLFSLIRVFDECGEWQIEMTANEPALPLLFNLRSYYFKYELWNALRLDSRNQLRMYEILKQHEFKGYRIISLKDLREQLGIDDTEYPLYADFRRDVLEPCMKALQENTDISFTCEPYKKGARGKILELKFIISKNEGFKDLLNLSDFIDTKAIVADEQDVIDLNDVDPDESDELFEQGKITRRQNNIISLLSAMDNEFTFKQVSLLYDIALNNLPSHITSFSAQYGHGLRCFDHFQSKYRYMLEKAESAGVRNRFGYMKSIIGKED